MRKMGDVPAGKRARHSRFLQFIPTYLKAHHRLFKFAAQRLRNGGRWRYAGSREQTGKGQPAMVSQHHIRLTFNPVNRGSLHDHAARGKTVKGFGIRLERAIGQEGDIPHSVSNSA